MTQTIFIPGPMPGLNDVIAMAKRHWAAYAKEKEYWTTLMALKCKEMAIRPLKRCFIDFTWVEKNQRRDPDNITAIGRKFILDGLVQAGVLENDGWSQVAGWSDKFVVDKESPGVKIEIAEGER